MTTVRVLSFHSTYGCRNRGRCCTSGWPIAVDGAERTRIELAIESGALIPARANSAYAPGAGPTGSALLASAHGRCVFHDDNLDGGCRIHRAIGHSALPLACRQFPRQSVRDPRGVSVTLSHYCPTANDLLVEATGPSTIVENAPAFPSGAEYVGLTAVDELPPLLHPRLAMDWESWWTFEELSVSLLSESTEPLSRLALAVEYAREWTVGSDPLAVHIRDAFARAKAAAPPASELSSGRITERIADSLAAVPEEWRGIAAEAVSPSVGRGFTPGHTRGALSLSKGSRANLDVVSRRYLAAHAFANWAGYQGEGLRTWFRGVETAASLLIHTADAGRADLVLRHLADSTALVDRWTQAERIPAIGSSS